MTALALACQNRHDEIVTKIIEKNKKCLTGISKKSQIQIMIYFQRDAKLAEMMFYGFQKYLLFSDEQIEILHKAQTCLVCNEYSDVNYIFEKCSHVIYCCDNCITDMTKCPFCRQTSPVKKVYLMTSQ